MQSNTQIRKRYDTHHTPSNAGKPQVISNCETDTCRTNPAATSEDSGLLRQLHRA